MDDTPKLKLPYIMAAQAQKHITHNEAIRALDVIVQLGVIDRDLSTAPDSPLDGDSYIIAGVASGDWGGHEGEIAAFKDNGWAFHVPGEGWLAWVADEDLLLVFDGTQWNELSGSGGGSVNPATLVGVNTTASNPDKLSVKSDAILFSHDDVTPGSGDIQTKLNKASSGNTASFLFQTDWSGRAEIGLAGDDDFHFKVSADGSTFHEAIIIDKDDGAVAMPNTRTAFNYLINGDFCINQRRFAGGALASGSYGHDRWKADSSGADYTTAPGKTITLTSGTLVQVIEQPGLASKQVNLSVEELTGGDLVFDIAGQTGTITAGSGRRGASITLGVGDNGNISVKITPASAAVSFKRVQLERGVYPSGRIVENPVDQYLRCQRYYFHTVSNGNQPVDGAGLTGALAVSAANTLIQGTMIAARFPVEMRSSPTITTLNPQSADPGNSGKLYNSFGNHIASTVGLIGNKGCSVWNAEVTSVGAIHYIHLEAEAEL